MLNMDEGTIVSIAKQTRHNSKNIYPILLTGKRHKIIERFFIFYVSFTKKIPMDYVENH